MNIEERPFRSPPARETRVNRVPRPTSVKQMVVIWAVLGTPILAGAIFLLFSRWSGAAIFAFGMILAILAAWLVSSIMDWPEHTERRMRLVRKGDPCTAVVVRATQIGFNRRQGLVSVRLDLLVQLSDGRDKNAAVNTTVSMVRLNKLVEGAILDIVVVPSDLSNLWIEW